MGYKVNTQQAGPGPVAAGGSVRGSPFTGMLPLLSLYFCLLLGDLAWSLKERAVQEVLKAQLREFSQSTVLLNIWFGALPATLSLLVGPLVGAWSDRTRTRLGRRIPFLLASAPLLAGSLVGLAYSEVLADFVLAWSGLDPAFRHQAVVVCMGLFWGLFELFSLTGNALFIALVNDTVPHAVLGRFFGAFRIVSLSVGVAFFYVVFGNNLPSEANRVLLAIAAFYFIAFMVVCVRVREPAYPPPVALPAGFGLGRLRAPGDEAPWFYVLLFAALALATTCLLPVNINSYNAIDQFGVDRSSFGNAAALTYCISIALALPLGWLADRFHPLWVGFTALGLYAVCMLSAWFLVVGRTSFLIWFVVHGVLAGAFLTGTASLLPSLLPRARFSELAAFSTSMTALLALVVTLTMGAVLDGSGRDFRLIFLAAGMVALVGTGLWYSLLLAHRRRSRA